MKTLLVVVDTEASVCQRLVSHLKIHQSNYDAKNITPNTTLGDEALIEDIVTQAKGLILDEVPSVFFVDLVVHEDEKIYSQSGQSSYDNLGLRVALALRKNFSKSPIFIITGKVSVPTEESLLSEASLEDVDGILTKDYFVGKSISTSRLTHIVEKGMAKRKLFGEGPVGDSPEMEQKFKILYSREQARKDVTRWDTQFGQEMFPIGVVFVDIDHFKKINAEFLEEKVDATLLKDFQLFVRKQCEMRGCAYRHGGEEFLILLPNSSIKESTEFAERLCRAVAGNSFRVDERNIQITVSVGVAERLPDMDIDIAILKANKAEHEAKERGRNRVEIAKDD